MITTIKLNIAGIVSDYFLYYLFICCRPSHPVSDSLKYIIYLLSSKCSYFLDFYYDFIYWRPCVYCFSVNYLLPSIVSIVLKIYFRCRPYFGGFSREFFHGRLCVRMPPIRQRRAELARVRSHRQFRWHHYVNDVRQQNFTLEQIHKHNCT